MFFVVSLRVIPCNGPFDQPPFQPKRKTTTLGPGPPQTNFTVEKNEGTLVSVVYFSRGALPKKRARGVRKGT